MVNSVNPVHTALSGAVWSGFALFAYAIVSETLGLVWSGSALFVYAIVSETLVCEILGHLP